MGQFAWRRQSSFAARRFYVAQCLWHFVKALVLYVQLGHNCFLTSSVASGSRAQPAAAATLQLLSWSCLSEFPVPTSLFTCQTLKTSPQQVFLFCIIYFFWFCWYHKESCIVTCTTHNELLWQHQTYSSWGRKACLHLVTGETSHTTASLYFIHLTRL